MLIKYLFGEIVCNKVSWTDKFFLYIFIICTCHTQELGRIILPIDEIVYCKFRLYKLYKPRIIIESSDECCTFARQDKIVITYVSICTDSMEASPH